MYVSRYKSVQLNGGYDFSRSKLKRIRFYFLCLCCVAQVVLVINQQKAAIILDSDVRPLKNVTLFGRTLI